PSPRCPPRFPYPTLFRSFVCTDDEAQSAMLHRFGAASAATRYFNLNRDESADMITFDVALRRDEDDWLEVLPDEIADQLHIRTRSEEHTSELQSRFDLVC